MSSWDKKLSSFCKKAENKGNENDDQNNFAIGYIQFFIHGDRTREQERKHQEHTKMNHKCCEGDVKKFRFG
jgi:hypothetical protein